MSNEMIDLKRHLYLSGVWSGVSLKANIKKTCVKERLDYMFRIC